ncbi:MAG: hypothetical protein ACQEW9_09585 [Bacteroidota bacterium]
MSLLIKQLFSTIALFLILAILPMGCEVFCNDPCGCRPKFEVKDFRITAFETLSLAQDGQRIHPSLVLPYDQTTKSFRVAQLETVAQSKESLGGLPGMAYACSPIAPQSIHRLIGLQLINKKEVILGDGTILEVGKLLNEFVKMNYFYASETFPLAEFLDGGLPVFSDDLFKLVWQNAPGKELVLEFDLQIQLENGQGFVLPDEILSIR